MRSSALQSSQFMTAPVLDQLLTVRVIVAVIMLARY